MKETITLKNYEIVDIIKRLNADDSLINSTSQDKTLPIRILWKINGNVKALRDIFDRIHDEEEKIDREYFNEEKAEANDIGGYTIKVEYRAEFTNKKDELFNIENTVDVEKINISELESFNFVPGDFKSIEFMLTDEDPAQVEPQV